MAEIVGCYCVHDRSGVRRVMRCVCRRGDHATEDSLAGWIAPARGRDSTSSKPNTAMLASADGRHLVTMPHLERSSFPWNWAHYPKNRKDEIAPWIEAFVNAREWM